MKNKPPARPERPAAQVRATNAATHAANIAASVLITAVMALAGTAGTATSAQAQSRLLRAANTPQIYLQTDVGISRFDKAFCEGSEGYYRRCDRSSEFNRIQAGLRFSNGMALEVGHERLGGLYVARDNAFIGLVSARAVTVGLAYQMPVWQDLGVVVRGGAAIQSQELRNPFLGTRKERNVMPQAGMGVNYALSSWMRVELGAEFTRMRNFKTEYLSGDRRLEAFYIGTQLSF